MQRNQASLRAEAARQAAFEIKERRNLHAKDGLNGIVPTTQVDYKLRPYSVRFHEQSTGKTQKAIEGEPATGDVRGPLRSRIPILAKRSSPPTGQALQNSNNPGVAVVVNEDEPMEVVEDKQENEIEDIDAEDVNNHLMCTGYVKLIYSYLFELEDCYYIRPNYMSGYTKLKPSIRAVVIEWLIQVHARYNFVHDTLFMAVSIVDLYFQSVDVPKDDVQLVGTTALFIAAKFEEVTLFDVHQAVFITNYTYERNEVLAMERAILKKLKFNFARPVQITFLRRFSKAAAATRLMHTLSKYFLELMLLDMEMAYVPPSLQAAAAVRLSMLVVRGDGWTPKMVAYTTYTQLDLDEPILKLLQFYHDHEPPRAKSGALTSIIAHKYADQKRGAISRMVAIDMTLTSMHNMLTTSAE